MTYPEHRQYTTAFLALGCVRVCVALLSEACVDNSIYNDRERRDIIKVQQQIAKVSKWEQQCSPLKRSGGKPGLSVGAIRDIDGIVEHVFTPPLELEDPAANFNAMAASLWATTIFLNDARNVAKLYTVGQAWYRLLQTSETLAAMFRHIVPDCDETGTELYMKAMEEVTQ